MVKSSRAIAKAVESGEYFLESREHYFNQYLMPITHKALFILISLFMCIGAYTIYDLSRTTSVEKKYPFAIIASDETKLYPLIKSIAKDNEPINLSVARYFANYYVENREGYTYQDFTLDKIQSSMDKIEALSTRKVFFDYQQYIDPAQNLDAPILRYRNTIRRDITIEKTEIPLSKLPFSAKIYFTASERDLEGSKQESKFVAELDFNMADIGDVMDKKSPLTFLVVRYRTYKL